MTIGLEEVCVAQIDLAPEAQEVGDGPFGHRGFERVNRAVFVTEGRISPGETGRGIEARTFAVEGA